MCDKDIFKCATKINEKLNHFLPQDSSANGWFGGRLKEERNTRRKEKAREDMRAREQKREEE